MGTMGVDSASNRLGYDVEEREGAVEGSAVGKPAFLCLLACFQDGVSNLKYI